MAEKNEAVEAEKAPKKAAAPKAAAEKKPAAKKAPAKTAASAAKADAPARSRPPRRLRLRRMLRASRPGVLKVHHLRPVPGSTPPRLASAVVRAPRVRPPVVVPRAPRRAHRSRRLRGWADAAAHAHPEAARVQEPVPRRVPGRDLEKLAELYPKGGDVTIGDLVAKGAVRKNEKVRFSETATSP